jgi:hypothetical protein
MVASSAGHFKEFLSGHFTIRDEDEDRIYVSAIFRGDGDATFADDNLIFFHHTSY